MGSVVRGGVASRASAKRRVNSAISASPTMRGGAIRMRWSLAALTIRPSSRARAATAPATGSVSPMPSSSPRPWTSVTSGEPMPRIAARSCSPAHPRVLDQTRPLDLAEHGVGGRGGERVAAEGGAVLAGLEQVGCRPEGDESPDREAAPMPLARRDGIRDT